MVSERVEDYWGTHRDHPWGGARSFLQGRDAGAAIERLMRDLSDRQLPATLRRALDVGGDERSASALRAHFEQVVVVNPGDAGEAEPVPGIRVTEDAVGDLGIVGGGRFDLVRCSMVPAFLEARAAGLLIKRLTKFVAPGGVLVLSAPSSIERKGRLALRWWGRIDPTRVRVIDPDEFAPSLTRGGLNEITVTRHDARFGVKVSEVVAERFLDRRARVLEGEDGWLFLDNDRNRVVAQHTGELLLSPDALAGWERVLRGRTQRFGDAYVHLIPPNAHAVWEERLPPEIPRGRPRPVLQLLERLEGTGLPVRYPLAELRAARETGIPYAATDTHWTAYGAFVGYGALLDALPATVAVRRIREQDVAWTTHEVVGDLGQRVEPRRAAPTVRAQVKAPAASVVRDNYVRNNGRIVHFNCPAAPDVRVLLLGDSFAYAMLRFLAETWRHLTFAHLYDLDQALVDEVAPELVISILNERFHTSVPDDEHGLTAAAWYERKLERGGVLTPEAARLYGGKLGWP